MKIQEIRREITMMCHGLVRSLFLVLLCLETVSFGIISNTDGYVFISGQSQTAFPGKKIKYDSRIHDFMFDNSGLGVEWFNVACVAGAKRGGRGGGRKARKRGKGRERLL